MCQANKDTKMTIQELIDFLNTKCVDLNKQVFIHDCEWDQDNPINYFDFDSEGNLIIY